MRQRFGRDFVVLGAALLLFPVAMNQKGPPSLGAPAALEAPAPAPIELEVAFPAEGAALGKNPPPLAIRLEAKDGKKVPPERLSFLRDGERLAMDCVAVPGGAECEPIFGFEEGEVALEVSVADRRGHRSAPVVRHFTVDRAAPAIDLAEPAKDFLATAAKVRVAGRVSEEAQLKIAGEEVALQPDRSFEIELPLEEGANVLLLSARDAAGNETVEAISGFCDSSPPQPVTAALVSAGLEGKKVEIAGVAGAAEPGMRIRWRNERTGQLVETDAEEDGAFEAKLVAAPGDQLVAVALDPFGRESEPTQIALPEPEPPTEAIAWLPSPPEETAWLPPLFNAPNEATEEAKNAETFPLAEPIPAPALGLFSTPEATWLAQLDASSPSPTFPDLDPDPVCAPSIAR